MWYKINMWIKILSVTKTAFITFAIFFVLFWVFIWNFSFVFKQKVIGEVQKIEHVSPQAIITNNMPMNPQVFSYSVAIKDLRTNEIHMASSEDRKWGAVQPGNCVVAAFFPYEPWRLSKGMTDRNARLLQNFTNCADVPDNGGFISWLKFFFLVY